MESVSCHHSVVFEHYQRREGALIGFSILKNKKLVIWDSGIGMSDIRSTHWSRASSIKVHSRAAKMTNVVVSDTRNRIWYVPCHSRANRTTNSFLSGMFCFIRNLIVRVSDDETGNLPYCSKCSDICHHMPHSSKRCFTTKFSCSGELERVLECVLVVKTLYSHMKRVLAQSLFAKTICVRAASDLSEIWQKKLQSSLISPFCHGVIGNLSRKSFITSTVAITPWS